MAVTANSIVTPQAAIAGTMGVVLSAVMAAGKTHDGTDNTALGNLLVYTVGANGGRVDKIIAKVAGTVGNTPSGTSTATVMRVFVNNGSANTTAANNALIAEQTIAATAVSAVASTTGYEIILNLTLPAGYKIYCGLGTAIGATNFGLAVSCYGADF